MSDVALYRNDPLLWCGFGPDAAPADDAVAAAVRGVDEGPMGPIDEDRSSVEMLTVPLKVDGIFTSISRLSRLESDESFKSRLEPVIGWNLVTRLGLKMLGLSPHCDGAMDRDVQ